MKHSSSNPTSWESSASWYHGLVGQEGHYYHQTIVIPTALKLLDFKKEATASLLDIAAGQAVLARSLPLAVHYTGVEIAPTLVKEGKKLIAKRANSELILGDATKPLSLNKKFSHAAVILALQNMEHPDKALENIAKHLLPSGKLVIVLNHPCYRIPRQSSWQIDEPKKLQYRRIDLYKSSLKIPIYTNPGKDKSDTTYSFHHPMSQWFTWLHQAGFAVDQMEELYSDKVSVGTTAKMENRARQEFPLFLAIQAFKK